MRIALLLLWLSLAAWFVLTPAESPLEGNVRERVRVEAHKISSDPPRKALSDPPQVHIGGVDQKCTDCHALFASLDVTPSQIKQHTEVRMQHGMNGRCYNCHNQQARNKLVLHDGETIGFSESTNLCAKCHGTVFRDWQKGIHGRTMGSWDASSGKQWRLRCVECHDPHSPAFGKLELLPGPNTLRMGEPRKHDTEAQERNPLERWKALLHDESHGSTQDH